MTALAATFLDALSLFAAVALGVLAVVTAIGAERARRRKLDAVEKAVAGIEALERAAADIRMHGKGFERGGADVELFLLAASVRDGRLDEDRARRLAAHFALDPSDSEKFAAGVLLLAKDPNVGFRETLEGLGEARRLLGPTPVAALERALGRAPEQPRLYVIRTPEFKAAPSGPYGFRTAAHVTGYVLRCDLVDRAVDAAPSSGGREPSP